jgi:DNA-binding GntR family transcriptional regulator
MSQAIPDPAGAAADTMFDASLAIPAQPEHTTDSEPANFLQPLLGRARPYVLTERIAASVLLHEPGWRLPRPSVLASRHRVPVEDIFRALDELATRHVIRRLPDGQFLRSSPADYLIPLEGIAGLGTVVDPMGARLACRRYRVTRQRPEEELRRTLRIQPGHSVLVLELEWTSEGRPAAVTRTYLAEYLAAQYEQTDWIAAETSRGIWPMPPAADDTATPRMPWADCRPRAIAIEMRAPPKRTADKLGLAPGQIAIDVRLRFDDTSSNRPGAITVAALRADIFRIALESGAAPVPGNARRVDVDEPAEQQ